MTETPLPLAIDVDGTLLRSDITQEMFWLGLLKYPWLAPKIFGLIKNDRPALKALLMPKLAGVFDPATLPYNPLVLKYARGHKDKGGQVILCSGSEGALIERIADHFDYIDAGFGTTATVNLVKGNKSKFLQTRYPDGFMYMGNSTQDFDVWVDADIALAIAPPKGTTDITDKHGGPVDILEPREGEAAAIFEAMRPATWPYIFMAIMITAFAAKVYGYADMSSALGISLIALVLIVGGGFLISDLARVDRLRAHPLKRHRPLPSGRLGSTTSILAGLIFIVIGAGLTLALSLPLKVITGCALALCGCGFGLMALKNRVFQ